MSTTPNVKDLFAEAAELPPLEREAFLARACGDAAVLEEVRSLLAAHERARRIFDGVGARTGPGPDAPERPGMMLGRYRLLQPIGEGGFGTVYMAEQREPVVRRVALKVIKPGMDSAQVIARFEAERQALAVMDHPHIAKVLDAGTTPSGRPYFVMELVKGEPITAYCDRELLTIPERLRLFVQVCHAVQHAHTKGVIHRDLKPSNILVSTQDGRPLARVIDFGIAKATDRRLTDRTVFTEFRQLIGTPEYMSPEQAEGNLDIDTRTDVYSLGVLLYELLTGSTPFDGRRLRSAAYPELQRIIREVEPPKPSTRLSESRETLQLVAASRRTEPSRLGTLVRGELDWIVMKSLEKDRARRYGSAADLAEDLERYLSGRAVQAAPPSSAYRVRKFVRRHRAGVTAGVLVGVALVLGIAGTTTGLVLERRASAEALRQKEAAELNAHEAAEQAKRADAQAQAALKSARVADAVNALMTTTIQRANRARQGGRADLTVREVMDAAAKDLLEGLERYEPEVELLLAKTIGQTYRELSLFEPAERMMRLWAQRAEEVHGPGAAETAEALNELATLLKARGDRAGAAELYGRVLTILDGLGQGGAEHKVAVMANTATLLAAEGRLAEAEAQLREAAAFYEGAGRTREHAYFVTLFNLANVRHQRGQSEDAAALLRRVRDLELAEYGPDDPRTLATLHALSTVLYVMGDPGAEAAIHEELATARRLLGNDHRTTANILHSLGSALMRRDPAQAEAAYREAHGIYTRIFGPEHPTTAEEAATLGGALMELGRFEEAETTLRGALEVLARDAAAHGGAWPSEAIYGAYRLGMLLERRGALAEAEAEARRVIEAAERSLEPGNRYEWTASALRSLLGGVLVRRAAAAPAAERAALLREAESLITEAAERLLTHAPKIGSRTRGKVVPDALERAEAVYAAWEEVEPTPERAAARAMWAERRRQWLPGP